MRQVEDIRGLKFKEPVRIGVYSLAQLETMLVRLMEKEMPDEKLRPYERGLKVLGLLPEDYDLKQGLLDLLQSQIGGFYDPDAKELRLVDRSQLDPEKASSGFSALLAGSGMKPEDADRIIMAHELTHALQDQHFGLKRFPIDVLDDDDMVTAVKSLVEGDATALMTAWMLKEKMGQTPERLFAMAPLIGMSMKASARMALKELGDTPPYLAQTLVFPYLEGMSFALAAGAGKRGFKGIDACYAEPPLSTEQVLHPRKHRGAKRDLPQVLTLPDLKPWLGERTRPATSNTLGELFTRILLEGRPASRSRARRAARGWDGDRYVLYETSPGRGAVLAWSSTWDSEKDAREAYEALALWLGAEPAKPEENAPDATTPLLLLSREEGRGDGLHLVGKEVSMVLDAPEREIRPLLQALITRTVRRERRELPPAESGR